MSTYVKRGLFIVHSSKDDLRGDSSCEKWGWAGGRELLAVSNSKERAVSSTSFSLCCALSAKLPSQGINLACEVLPWLGWPEFSVLEPLAEHLETPGYLCWTLTLFELIYRAPGLLPRQEITAIAYSGWLLTASSYGSSQASDQGLQSKFITGSTDKGLWVGEIFWSRHITRWFG